METLIKGITLRRDVTYESYKSRLIHHNVALCMSDVTGIGYMYHYYHFIEYVIAIFYVLHTQQIKNKDVSLILFPNNCADDWKGRHYEHNYKILKALFPNLISVINKADFRQSNISIEYLYTIKRYDMDHSSINKMCANIYNKIPFKFSNKQVDKIHKFFNVTNTHKDIPQLTFIKRKSSHRNFNAIDENRIINSLQSISTIIFKDVYMEDLSFKEQIQLAYDTDVMIGIHGNGLTHSLFMKPHKLLIEIFPANIFNLDYFTLSSMRKHKYYAMCNDNILNFNKLTDYNEVGHNTSVEFKTTETLENIIKTNLYVI